MASIKVRAEGFDQIVNRIHAAAEKAALIVAEQAEKDTRIYVPARNLSMANRTSTTSKGAKRKIPSIRSRSIKESKQAREAGEAKIIYPGPYAQYLYNGKLMVDPETGSAWARKGASKVKTDKNLVFGQGVHSKAQSHWFEASKAQNKEKWVRVAKKAVKHELQNTGK